MQRFSIYYFSNYEPSFQVGKLYDFMLIFADIFVKTGYYLNKTEEIVYILFEYCCKKIFKFFVP